MISQKAKKPKRLASGHRADKTTDHRHEQRKEAVLGMTVGHVADGEDEIRHADPTDEQGKGKGCRIVAIGFDDDADKSRCDDQLPPECRLAGAHCVPQNRRAPNQRARDRRGERPVQPERWQSNVVANPWDWRAPPRRGRPDQGAMTAKGRRRPRRLTEPASASRIERGASATGSCRCLPKKTIRSTRA